MYIYYLYQVISSKFMLLIIRYLAQKLSKTYMHISYHVKGWFLSFNEFKAFRMQGVGWETHLKDSPMLE